MSSNEYFVYILGNVARTVLYTGVTNNLKRRVWEHKQSLVRGFTQKYQVHDLLLYESYNNAVGAIEREKQIKSWNRKRKESLIMEFNPSQMDLYEKIV